MVRIEDKSLEDFIRITQDVLQNSLITTSYSFTYEVGKSNYTLPGFEDGNERIFSIERIEGTGFLPEDYITESDLTQGTDYSLWDNYDSVEEVESGFGTASDEQVFNGITIVDQTFKDNSTVHVKYKYQNPNYVPILTNFSPNSVLRMILTAILVNNQQSNSQLANSINTFGIQATGSDLDRIATLVGLERTQAERTIGEVLVENTDTSDYTITTSHRFASITGTDYIAFRPLSSVSVSANGNARVNVEAVVAGKSSNVGSNSISFAFTDPDLSIKVPSTVTVSNPPTTETGEDNLFNNGVDEESDSAFRGRIVLAFSQTKTSSYNTIEKAVEDVGLTKDVKVYDIDLKKDLGENQVLVAVATEQGNLLSETALTQLVDAANTVKAAGSFVTIRQVMNTYIGFDITIYVSTSVLSDTVSLEADLKEQIDEFIHSKKIGEDILPTSVVSIIKGNADVIDMDITANSVSEYVSEVSSLDSQVNLATSGSTDTWIALEVPFNSATNFVSGLSNSDFGATYDYDLTDGDTHVNGTIDLSALGEPIPIDDRTSPRINRGVEGYDGLIRPSARDRTDYFLSNTRDSIIYNPNISGGDGIYDSHTVFANYNYYDNTKLDGFRIRLGGDSGNVVAIDFGYGTNPDSANFNSLATATATLDGEEKLYEFEFSSQIDTDNDPTYSPDNDTFWLIIKHSSGSGNSYMPVNTTGETIPFTPTFQEDNTSTYGDTFSTASGKRGIWHSYTKKTTDNVYEKIIIPTETDQPENPVPYSYNFTFERYIEG